MNSQQAESKHCCEDMDLAINHWDYLWYDDRQGGGYNLKVRGGCDISYCPFCGRKLMEEKKTVELPAEDLTTYRTKELLSILKSARAMRGAYFFGYDNGSAHSYTTIELLKEELAKRPHIPNKSERKKARQEAAKAKKNR